MTIDIPPESPHGNVLNYSIVSSDEDDNPLKVKLKISENSKKVPIVVLKKLDNINQYVVSPSSSRPRKVRNFDEYEMDLSGKSIRGIQTDTSSPKKKLKSSKVDDTLDVEMISPPKEQKSQRTPRKRNGIDKNLENLCTSITEKVKLVTPVKRSLTKTDFADRHLESSVVSPSKKGMMDRTPVKDTPKRRGSRRLENLFSPIGTDENMSEASSRRKSYAPVRYSDEPTPHKTVKVNLNESFRRSVLKSRVNIENVKQDSSKKSSRRSTRSSYTHFYDSDEDEAIQVAEALKKSEIEVSASRRVLRSRSISTISNGSTASMSDGDFSMDDIPLSCRRITRSRTNSTTKSTECVYKSPERVAQQKNPKTPKTPKNKRQTIGTPRSLKNTPKTPKSTLKLLRDGVITPSMHSRSSILPGDSTPLMKARSQLHVSYVPTSLPCREKEYLDVYNFLSGKLNDGCGGCMYISGVPGTGKTATVTSVIDSLVNDKEIPKFNYVSINGMRLTEPRQAYVEIWKQLTGKTVPWEQAQSLLEDRFTKKKNMNPVVMLIDELDILCTKRQDVVYNLLDWPTKSKDQLIVITIANTMDLPERLLMSRVTSRLGLTRLTFQAYTHKQLMEIVTKRLMGTNSFNSDAVQLVARKVASVSGDARRALDICRQAAEIAEEEGKAQMVNIMHINEALTAMITQPRVTAIRRCSRLQKLLLQAIVAEIERTGVEETTFADSFKMLVSCCALDGFKMVSMTTAQRALCQLSACKLILTDQKCSNIYQRIILNVSVHDVYFALKKE